jgi:hypothetical protein
MADQYLTGGKQTTVNSTITELFPALCFNNKFEPKTSKDLETFINSVKLDSFKSKKTFLSESDMKSGKEFIVLMSKIKPNTKQEKIENAFAITKFLYATHKNRSIDKVIWGYRKKPVGVPTNHAGDIFIFFKDKTMYPAITGISLKAGTKKSAEPKMNSYVKTTLIKPMWKKSAPNAVKELKKELWQKVYSKVPGLSKQVNADNYFTEIGAKEIVRANPEMVEKLINFFEVNPKGFDELYGVMNKVCREKLIDIINNDCKAAKEWMGSEFRLEKKDEKIPLILVKAVGSKYEMDGDPLADMLPLIKTIKAYLNENSVQEWFIDVGDGKKTLTLLMTIRSDSEFRRAKPKGKLGAFVGLKLLYRGIKK